MNEFQEEIYNEAFEDEMQKIAISASSLKEAVIRGAKTGGKIGGASGAAAGVIRGRGVPKIVNSAGKGALALGALGGGINAVRYGMKNMKIVKKTRLEKVIEALK